MGGPMAINLIKKGYAVNAFDLNKDKVNEVIQAVRKLKRLSLLKTNRVDKALLK